MVKISKAEIWGGIECTINRVDDAYFDQLHYAGHYNRKADIDLVADLGISKIRYPVLWEKHQPQLHGVPDWTCIEENLNRLRERGVEPIAGLVHHGSGPTYAPISSEDFATRLADYALLVAKKFPWIKYYTPVNEPLTTARFCGLYGFWYPHLKSDKDFIRLLINESKATILAMQAIKSVNPHAKLVLTEDLGKTYSTPLLSYQAKFENKRRWLSIDLLLGRVNERHPLWKFITGACNICESDLQFFIDNPCPPNILGFNHYLTSERYIDENLQKYPLHTHGGNHKHRYADVEAVRIDLNRKTGIYTLLKEAWDYFGIPMAITEVHLGCTREEQLRWLKEIWETAAKLNTEGVEVKAVTGWAMFGAYGWNKLLTHPEGKYEPGIFDISSGKPRPTALSKQIQCYAKGLNYQHPVLETKGWWKRDVRVLYFKNNIRKIKSESKCSQPILILGKTGTLGGAFAKLCEVRGLYYQLLDRNDLDLSNSEQIEKVIAQKRPWAIVNAAGYVRVDDAEADFRNCITANADGPAKLANLSAKYNFKLLTFSSDLVFDGLQRQPYLECSSVSPLNVYGKSKALAEKYVLERDPSALVIRTSAFFGPWDNYNFVSNVIATLKNEQFFKAVNDVVISPTYVPDLVQASLDLLLDDECGIWHLANEGNTTWYNLALNIAQKANLDVDLVTPSPLNIFNYPAKRPLYSVLSSERGKIMPTLDDAIARYFAEKQFAIESGERIIKAKAG